MRQIVVSVEPTRAAAASHVERGPRIGVEELRPAPQQLDHHQAGKTLGVVHRHQPGQRERGGEAGDGLGQDGQRHARRHGVHDRLAHAVFPVERAGRGKLADAVDLLLEIAGEGGAQQVDAGPVRLAVVGGEEDRLRAVRDHRPDGVGQRGLRDWARPAASPGCRSCRCTPVPGRCGRRAPRRPRWTAASRPSPYRPRRRRCVRRRSSAAGRPARRPSWPSRSKTSNCSWRAGQGILQRRRG